MLYTCFCGAKFDPIEVHGREADEEESFTCYECEREEERALIEEAERELEKDW